MALRDGKPSEARKVSGKAMASAGLLLSRQGPCELPAALAAKSLPTPQRRSSAKRAGPRFHCLQAIARKRRLIHWSSPRNTDGVSQKPK